MKLIRKIGMEWSLLQQNNDNYQMIALGLGNHAIHPHGCFNGTVCIATPAACMCSCACLGVCSLGPSH